MASAFEGFAPAYQPTPDKYKDSLIEELKASTILTVNGAFNMMDDKYNVPVNEVEPGFSHLSDDTKKLYSDYGVSPGDEVDFYDSRGLNNLIPRLERYRARKEASERLQEDAPFMQYPMQIATSFADPVGLALAPFGYKVMQGIEALNNASRLSNAVKIAGTSVIASVPSEYMLQSSADSVNTEELAYVAGFASLFGGGIGSLLPTNALVDVNKIQDDMLKPPTESDIIARQEEIFGINDFDHTRPEFEGKIEGLKKHFIWSPIGNMMKSKNDLVRKLGNALEKSPVALTNGDKIVTSAGKTAMSTKYELNGRYNKFLQEMEQDFKEAKRANPNLKKAEFSQDLGRRYRVWLKDIEEEAMLKYDNIIGEEYKEVVPKPLDETQVDEGYTRLYRAESPTVKFQDVFNTEGLTKFARSDKPGKYYTTDLDYADYYRETYGRDATISYIDVPTTRLDEFRLDANEFKVDLDLVNMPKEDGRFDIYRKVTGNDEIDLDQLDAVVIDYLKREVVTTRELPQEFKKIQRYYDDLQKAGEAANVSALKGKSGLTYMNRVFNKEAIEKVGADEASNILFRALKSNPITRRQIERMLGEGRTLDEIEADMKEYAKNTIYKIQRSSVYDEMDITDVRGEGVPSPLKGRILQIDEEVAQDILINDIGQLTEYYNYKTSGKIALKKHIGIEKGSDIKAIEDSIQDRGRELGMSAKEIGKDLEMFRAVVDSVNGTREIARRPNTWGQKSARMFTKFNYVTLGGTFGLNTVGEIGSLIATNGLKSLKYFVPSVKDTISMYRGKPTKETTNELLALGIGEQIYRSNRVLRYDSLDTMNSTGFTESLLDKGSNLMSNASGLNFMTTTLELMAGASTIEDLMRMAAKSSLSRAEQKRLARLGLSVEDIQGIQQHSAAQYENGYLMAYNFNDWTDQALVNKIKDAISEVVKNAVLQADPTTIPVWATNPDNPLLKIATQFMRFPMVAHERLFIKGLDEMSTRQAVGFLASAGLMASIYTLREEAMVQAGIIDELDRKYDWDTDEGMKNLGVAVINKIPHLGIMPTVFDYGNTLFNAEAKTYGTDATTTVLGTLGRANQAVGIIKDIQDGNMTESNQKAIKMFTPYYSLPYVKAGVDALTKD